LKTMSRAVSLLAREGVLDVSQGRRIRVVSSSADTAWLARRLGYLNAEVRELKPGMSLESFKNNTGIWGRYDDYADRFIFEEIESTKAHLLSDKSKPSEAKVEGLLKQAHASKIPGMLETIKEKRITAILAPSQMLATRYLYWLHCVGLSVPDESSLLSFDSHFQYEHHPISTVDQNYGTLGYSAAHISMGDIPVKADRLGCLGSEPRLVDRGSLGPPKDGRR
jgi:hypothetical protein